MPPNTQINLIKDPTKQDRTVILRKKNRIARMEEDCNFWTECPEIKAAILMKFSLLVTFYNYFKFAFLRLFCIMQNGSLDGAFVCSC